MARLKASVPLTLDLPVDLANLVVVWSQAAGLSPGDLAVGALRLGLHMLENQAGSIAATLPREEVAP